jgi:hypothetical protein
MRDLVSLWKREGWEDLDVPHSTLFPSTPFNDAFLLPATSFSHSLNMASV